jgi:cyclic beta-1,2-glucan synthetase
LDERRDTTRRIPVVPLLAARRGVDKPLRGELLSADRLAEAARDLAGRQKHIVPTAAVSTPLIGMLTRAAAALAEFNRTMSLEAREAAAVSPSVEWLLDNHYLIEEQVRLVLDDLPPEYGVELPRLTSGELKGYPRVYEAAELLLSHTDSRLETDHLERYVMAYQEVSALQIGEVWAVPIVLRIALVENLRRLAATVAAAQSAERAAEAWADDFATALQDRPAAVPDMLKEMGREPVSSLPAFIIRLSSRVQDLETDIGPISAWVDRRLVKLDATLDGLTQQAHQRQAADQVSIANTITAIRFITASDWRAFFERCSLVETELRDDPAGIYAVMDFVSRDRYRHAIETLARRCPSTELEVAQAAVTRAAEAIARDASDLVAGHVGWYLISSGRYDFEKQMRYNPRSRELAHRGPLSHHGTIYIGLLALFTLALAILLGGYARSEGARWLATLPLMLLALVPLSDLGVNLTNRIASLVWPPRVLPKLDHEHPVADAHRTIVVVPTLLTSPESVRRVLDDLEVAQLANSDPNIHFAVIGDLRAAAEETAGGDAAILQAAEEGVAELNEKHGEGGERPFHVFVRSRRMSESEQVWMGWERKRGALTEFGRLLRGATDTSFTTVAGDPSFLPGVTFVMTLDADTVLPRDAARKAISTIAHPLNRARVDERARLVRSGYGLVQPRVGVTLPSAGRSLYAKLNSGSTGIDPYAGAVSDTYQDVFGEGSFTGKGIYEVDVFNAVLEGRIPEGRLLSHDLMEGNFLRTALASDLEVLDDQPASYLAGEARMHRWVRGDWQTLPWLMRWVPGEGGVRYRNPLSRLHRFKILDNLRRSLLPMSLVVLGAAGWLLIPHPSWVWPAALGAVVLFPAYSHALDSLLSRPRGIAAREVLRPLWSDLKGDTLRVIVAFVTLPHEAYLRTDAAVRALWRMYVSHRGLLEWTTAAEAERSAGTTIAAHYAAMWPGVALVWALSAPALVLVPQSRAWLAPALLAWALSPVVAWAISRPIVRAAAAEPSAEDIVLMRRVARKTWRFFEAFFTAEDRWLMPDNYQEDPKGEIAHRTSPTNMGLQLIAGLTAHDLGYVSLSELVIRTARTMETMAGLERFRGHFYNWYETTTMQPLRPTYVSTVDSGNLAGHLLALRQGLHELADCPLIGPQALPGIADTLLLALEDLLQHRADLTPAADVDRLRQQVDELLRRVRLAKAPGDLGAWAQLLDEIARVSDTLPQSGDELGASDVARVHVDGSLGDAAEAVSRFLEDIDTCAPWARRLTEVPAAVTSDARAAGLAPLLAGVPSLRDLAAGLDSVLVTLASLASEPPGDNVTAREVSAAWAVQLREGVIAARPQAGALFARLLLLADMATEMWEHTDFAMLYDANRELFSIGYNTAEGRLDDSYYDMLASECRLASFVAIAKGELPQEHWFRLGRGLTRTDGSYALLSWSASMFEYLMPPLVMRTWPGTLLDDTYEAVVRRQIEYGRERGVPWGVSESAFNAKDAELTYQYQAFGVPGLGLKRGLSDDVVVAPYATLLAMQVDHASALANLARLTDEGAEGRFGYYESLDYTPGRVPAGQRRAVVKTYMAHHQGMGFVALGNELTGMRMRERFHADPMVESAELLLQERVPRHVRPASPHVEEVEFVRAKREMPLPVARSYPTPHTPTPATHFLSNGRYSVMVTNAGGGYSRWEGRSVTRYREDITRDCWGQFVYIRDTRSGEVWSSTHQPTCVEADDYHCIFTADRAEYRRLDGDVETYTEVVVSPEDDVEIRRVTITNHGRTAVELELTSYFEIALSPQGADQAHRTFSNLFVETEAVDELRTLLFTRRPRSAEEERVWGFHTLACESEMPCDWTYETDRAVFLGRLRTPSRPRAVYDGVPLSGTVGPVLDPVASIRQTVRIQPGDNARVAFATGVSRSREEALRCAEKHSDIRSAQRAIDLAWGTSQIELRDLGITPDEAVTFQRLASRLLLTDPTSPLKQKTKVESTLKMDGLWSIGISGDNPILLVKIDRLEETPLVRQVLLAHQYWRHKGFVIDLVILNTRPSAYVSELDGRLRMLVRTGHALQLMDKPGGVFLRNADQMPGDVANLLDSVARAFLQGDRGPLRIQLDQRGGHPTPPDPLVPRREPDTYPLARFDRPVLNFDNGYGGVDGATDEYVVVLEDGATTPAPWINVMASPEFGTMVSEAGVGCTWALNSHENRLTTWNNDPVSDGTGELFYIRDEETGQFWSPTAAPVRDDGPYVTRHGRGYTTFEHVSHGVYHELVWFAAADDPVRVARLTLKNLTKRSRSLSVTHFVEWALGDSRSKAQQRVVTWYDTEARMLTAHNHFNLDFPGRVAFLASSRKLTSYTASRTEFLGRNGTPTDPAAMHRRGLGGLAGRFHDNCGALMCDLVVEPGESVTVDFLLGQADDLAGARELVARYRRPEAVASALAQARERWDAMLGTLQVNTPDPALDAMVNGAALYQTLACRVWGRTALYQSSGAFGFRDQLQDVMALMLARPDLARAQIVEASSHQFVEGDVLHWWQPHSGRGVRTRFVDDRVWLPFVTADYLEATGDVSVLAERTPYIAGPQVADGAEDAYLSPVSAGTEATVYEHCVAALERSRGVGPHGLPLMGGGDWNDGMNRIGIGGVGESVWMAWFLILTLKRFAPVCEAMGEPERAADYRAWCKDLSDAVDREAWDGSWYRRAYFDDGTALGTHTAEECRIDAIAQAWAWIAGSSDRDRAMRALEAVEEKLVRWEDGLIALLSPPFDHMAADPGYIKGYVPGVRENGGQYTHGALWVVMAYALMGDGDEALSLLDLINPINHALTRETADVYRVEPYVVAADVYAVSPHVGRGGWTWYTGSASWFYQTAVRSILGIRTVADFGGAAAPGTVPARFLRIDPCIPKRWKSFSAELREGGSVYEIRVRNPRGVNCGVERVELDGAVAEGNRVPLVDDGERHVVTVTMLGG